MSTSNHASLPKLSRRLSLQLGAATTAVGLLVVQEAATPVQAKDLPPDPHTTPFVVPLPVYEAKQAVSVLTPQAGEYYGSGECGRAPHQRWAEFLPQKFYNLNVRQTQHSFHPELPTQTVWGFDGLVPGPTFAERYGVPIVVRIYNDLPANTVGFGSPEMTTHLHNLHTASESDGFAGDYYSATRFGPTLTGAGAYKDFHHVNAYAGFSDPRYSATNGDPREALGTLFYHDHRVDFTAPNIYRGLVGYYLLFDDIDSGNELDTNPKALRLPSGVGKYDIPLVFDDKVFDSSGYLAFDQFATKGILGNKVCVNGKVQPFFKVERRKYRFRLLDTGPSRFYEFYLANGGGGLNLKACQINDKYAGSVAAVPLSQRKPAAAPGAGPYATEAGLRTVASGDMGADPAAIQREIEKSTASLQNVKDPESIALLQGYIADLKGLQERLSTSKQPPPATSAAKAPPDQSFTYIANDGNLLPAPLTTSKLELAPAERADFVIDFARYPIGTTLYLANRLVKIDGRGPDGLLTKAGTQILRFDIDADPPTPDLSRVPAILRLLPPINLTEVVRNRFFEFGRENESGPSTARFSTWTIRSPNPNAEPPKSGRSKARAAGTTRFISILKKATP